MFVGTLTYSKDAWPTLIYTAIFLLIVWFMKPIVRAWWMVRNIPGAPTIPIIGNVHTVLFLKGYQQRYEKVVEWINTYGPVVRFQILHINVIVINNAEDAKTIGMNSKIRARGPFYKLFGDMYMKGALLFLRDDKWSARRKLINNAFQFKNVVTYLDTFAKLAEELCGRLTDIADGRIVDIRDHLIICTLGGAMDTAIGGMDVGEKRDYLIAELDKKMRRLFDLTTVRACNPFVWPSWTNDLTSDGKIIKDDLKWINNLVDQQIALAYENASKSNGKKNDNKTLGEKKVRNFSEIVFEAAIQEGSSIPPNDVRSDVLLLGTASNSISNVLTYFLMAIGIFPEYQERLFEEQRDIFGDSLRPAKYEDITKMPLLDIVLKETLRLFPPFPLATRYLTFDVPISNGYVLPAGTYITLNMFNIHYDPQNYVDPAKFWPERWLPENSVGRHPFAFVPFGVGNRNCVAVKYAHFQMKATISRMLRQFRFTNDYTVDEMKKAKIAPLGLSEFGYNVRIAKR